MAEALDTSTLTRWRRQPISFIQEILRDPETGRPFELFDAQKQFFAHAWQINDDGRLTYPDQCFGAIKKTGKTGTAAMHLLTTTLIFSGKFAEGYAIANDLEQAQGRVFQAIKRICEASPYLKREADITQQRITFPQTGAVIQAIGSDYASAAGANPAVSSFDELWGYTSERSRRLWDEMVPSPARKISCRLVTSYAGFENESELLLELFRRGMAQPLIGDNLHAGDGLLLAWHKTPQAVWQTEAWLAEMRRSLRPNQYLRMIENQFVTSESSFVSMAAWDRCVDPRLGPMPPTRAHPVYIGCDASTKHDQTAVVAVTFDRKSQCVRLAFHRTFQPTPDQPLDFEATVEATLLDLNKRFLVRQILFDPYQLQSTSQRLLKQGLRIAEFPQSSPNLTAASQNLYDLIQSGNLIAYPSEDLRLAISRAVAVETPRGWRISKATQSHKIDVVVALAMACYAAVQGQGATVYDLDALAGVTDDEPAGPILRRAPGLSDELYARLSAPVALIPRPS
jgi:phage terminase large subunit-like protein